MIICTLIPMNLLISATKSALSQYIKHNLARCITLGLPVQNCVKHIKPAKGHIKTHKKNLLIFFQEYFSRPTEEEWLSPADFNSYILKWLKHLSKPTLHQPLWRYVMVKCGLHPHIQPFQKQTAFSPTWVNYMQLLVRARGIFKGLMSFLNT